MYLFQVLYSALRLGLISFCALILIIFSLSLSCCQDFQRHRCRQSQLGDKPGCTAGLGNLHAQNRTGRALRLVPSPVCLWQKSEATTSSVVLIIQHFHLFASPGQTAQVADDTGRGWGWWGRPVCGEVASLLQCVSSVWIMIWGRHVVRTLRPLTCPRTQTKLASG